MKYKITCCKFKIILTILFPIINYENIKYMVAPPQLNAFMLVI